MVVSWRIPCCIQLNLIQRDIDQSIPKLISFAKKSVDTNFALKCVKYNPKKKYATQYRHQEHY